MSEQIAIVSDSRRYPFGLRQVFYRLRPIIMKRLGENLDWGYFSQTLVPEYESHHGEEPNAYRDPRGTFYHPHTGDSFPLGTLQVEEYRRPEWRFNKVVFIEKEGFFEALKADGWPERHDCALMTSKGQPSRAARDLIDLIGDSDEPVQVFCLHDCDAAGTLILQSLQEETRARPRRNVEIIDLGLNPPEARELADQGFLEIEDISYQKTQGVAEYVEEDDCEWLQEHRVELNAFTTPDFIAWLDKKMGLHTGKLVPPPAVLATSLDKTVQNLLRQSITNRVLSEARVEDQVREAHAELSHRVEQLVVDLPDRVAVNLEVDPSRHWSAVVDEFAESVVRG